MTTTVIVHAHCAKDTKVSITTKLSEVESTEVILRDGERYETVVYDAREIVVKEIKA